MFLYFYSHSKRATKILDFNLFLIENIEVLGTKVKIIIHLDTLIRWILYVSLKVYVVHFCNFIIVFTILSKSVKKRKIIQVTVQNTKSMQM